MSLAFDKTHTVWDPWVTNKHCLGSFGFAWKLLEHCLGSAITLLECVSCCFVLGMSAQHRAKEFLNGLSTQLTVSADGLCARSTSPTAAREAPACADSKKTAAPIHVALSL